MPPSLALLAWFLLLLALLGFDPAKKPGTSLALWVPVTWMFIVASRLPSQWANYQLIGSSVQELQEGNPLDRTIWLLLIVLAIGVLLSRSFRWGEFFVRNLALMAFLSFALLSVAWSGFPLITFKRWFRDLGGYLVILIVLSDPQPLEAVRTVLRRLCYLLIPLSIVLIKYYIGLSRQYSPWSGETEYVGVATSKNMLGVVCLISGIFFFWDTVTRWSERKDRKTKRIILVNLAFMVMTLWLLRLASSATSTVCLVIGCLVIAAAYTKACKRHPGFLKTLVPASFFLYVILAMGFGMSGELNQAIGRQANFTDRTHVWHALLGMGTNPLVGTGYASFWLGSRLQTFWLASGIHVSEAHNGYLEVYLELGLVGLFLICAFLVASYRRICKRLKSFTDLSALMLASWIALLFYNVTEAAFGGGLLWMVILFGAMSVPERIRNRFHKVPAFGEVPTEEIAVSPYEMAGDRR